MRLFRCGLEAAEIAVIEAYLPQQMSEAELRHLADHDPLTGLQNRRRFRSELDQHVSFTARYGGQGPEAFLDGVLKSLPVPT